MNFNTTKRNDSFLAGTMGNINTGLREYMLRVYRLMGLGLLVSAGTAYLGTLPQFMRLIFQQERNLKQNLLVKMERKLNFIQKMK